MLIANCFTCFRNSRRISAMMMLYFDLPTSLLSFVAKLYIWYSIEHIPNTNDERIENIKAVLDESYNDYYMFLKFNASYTEILV